MTSCKPPPTCIDASPIPDANDSRMSAIPYEANLTPMERHPLGRPQRCEMVRRVAQGRLEASNPKADQTPLHPVDQARALAAGALGILLRQRRDRDHVA